jgi:hypothetical protein
MAVLVRMIVGVAAGMIVQVLAHRHSPFAIDNRPRLPSVSTHDRPSERQPTGVGGADSGN